MFSAVSKKQSCCKDIFSFSAEGPIAVKNHTVLSTAFLDEGNKYYHWHQCSCKNFTYKTLLLLFFLSSRWNHGDSCPVFTGMISAVPRERSHCTQAFRFHLEILWLEEMTVSVCSQPPIIPFCTQKSLQTKDFNKLNQ